MRYCSKTETVLNGLSFKIKPYEKVGVVGWTGAGKSSMCLALCWIVEALAGKIKIDDTDISKLELNCLWEQITIIPQEPSMFKGTLRFNLDPTGKFKDMELWQILRKAQFDKDLEMIIDYNGSNISSGEK